MTYDGIGDCEVCGSEDSVMFRNNTKLFEENEICVECGFGYQQSVVNVDNGKNLVRFIPTPLTLEGINSIRAGFPENQSLKEFWSGLIPLPEKCDRLTKLKEMDCNKARRKYEYIREGVDCLNDKYFTTTKRGE